MKKLLTLFLVLAITVAGTMMLTACGENNPNVKEADVAQLEWSDTDAYTLELVDGKVVSNQDYIVVLEKQADKDFVVLNFADIQLSEWDWRMHTQGEQTAVETMKRMVAEIRPDLITLTGDQTYGEELSWKKWIELLDSFEIPWAPTFGNHDNQENDVRISYQAKMLSESKYCVYKNGPTNLGTNSNGSQAIGNYIINVVEKNNGDFKVLNSLIMMNTRDNQSYSGDKYKDYTDADRVNDSSYASWTEEQIAWYKWAIKGVQPYGKDNKVESTVIMHIPNYAYIKAYEAAYNSKADIADKKAYLKEVLNQPLEDSYKAENWNEGYKDSYGVRHEEGGTAPLPDGVDQAFLDFDDNPETDFISTRLVLSGHDHINNYVVTYNGVTYAYALKTGSGCYWEKDLSGGTIITINSDGHTSLRHEYVKVPYTLIPVWSIILIVVVAVGVILAVTIILKKKKAAKAPDEPKADANQANA